MTNKTVAKKSQGINPMGMDAYKPGSSIMLEGKDAKAMAKVPMGKKAKIVVHGVKTRHVINSDGSHSIEMRPHSVSPFNDDSAVTGPNTKESDNDSSNRPNI